MERHIETLVYTDEIEQDPAYKEHVRYLANKFLPSKKGQEYKFLVREDGFVVMSNSEFEKNSQWPLYQAVERARQRNRKPKILLVGWGIGLVIDEIKKIAPESNITVVEKYPKVIELTPPPNYIKFIMKDVQKLTAIDFFFKRYDLIWLDIEERENNEEFLRKFLKRKGELLKWCGKTKVYLPKIRAR